MREREFAEQMRVLCDDSGHKIDGQMIDTATLVHVLENTSNLGPHFDPQEQHLAPVAQLIAEESFGDEMRRAYISTEHSLPVCSVVDSLTTRIHPTGILAYDKHTMDAVPGLDRFRSILLSRGHVNSLANLCLSLPVSRTIDIENTRSARIGDQSTLYFVIGPHNELLLGDGVGSHVPNTRSYTPSMVMNGRIIDHVGRYSVFDQAYTGAFIFASPTDTEFGILDKIRSRCLTNTSCQWVGDAQFRSIAIIKLGTVPILPDLILKTTNDDGTESFLLDTFTFSPGQWNVSDMWYRRPLLFDGDVYDEVGSVKADIDQAPVQKPTIGGEDPRAGGVSPLEPILKYRAPHIPILDEETRQIACETFGLSQLSPSHSAGTGSPNISSHKPDGTLDILVKTTDSPEIAKGRKRLTAGSRQGGKRQNLSPNSISGSIPPI